MKKNELRARRPIQRRETSILANWRRVFSTFDGFEKPI